MKLPLYQVDAFTQRSFAGNPAAVCLLSQWLDDAVLAAIAAENNLSETAFVVPAGDDWELRWFTPTAEVDLCGHATLATAFVLFHRSPDTTQLRFSTREAGELRVERRDDTLVMNFPSRPPKPIETPPGLVEALGGAKPQAILRASKTMAVFETETQVRAIAPDFGFIAQMDGDGLIVTAPGDDVDFVSRYFAPHVGIDEDPVTGSAHCTLAPYWAQRLGRDSLRARQVSKRSGDLRCTVLGDRVELAGHAVLYLEGTIDVPT
ncbi:MAG: PhzF family phenazine biosynthesis protein [Myxococcota bacterium]